MAPSEAGAPHEREEAALAEIIAFPARTRESWCPECSPGEPAPGDREGIAFLSHLATRHPSSPSGRAARECLAGLGRGAVS